MHQTTTAFLLIVLLPLATSKTAFLIIDVQNCFVPGGTLAVTKGDDVIAPINRILDKVKFDVVVRSQDWHCKNHVSFASQHQGAAMFSTIPLNYTASGDICGNYTYKATKKECSSSDVRYQLEQTMWPDHCVIDTNDAGFVNTVNFPKDVLTVRKGYHCQVDSYSAFNDNGGFSTTELHTLLKARKITRVYVAGLALDYCVSWTAKDAAALKYESFVVVDASKAIANESLAKEKKAWQTLGVKTIDTETLISDAAKDSGGVNVFQSGLLVVVTVVLHLTFILTS